MIQSKYYYVMNLNINNIIYVPWLIIHYCISLSPRNRRKVRYINRLLGNQLRGFTGSNELLVPTKAAGTVYVHSYMHSI